MNLDRKDMYGLGTSLGVHVLALVLFYFLTAGGTQPQQLGFVEVDLGAFSTGQPVQQADDPPPDAAEAAPEEAQPEPTEPTPDADETAEQPPAEQPEEAATPVELPEQEAPIEDPEETPPTEEAPAPEPETAPEQQPEEALPQPEPETEAEDAAGGAAEGTTGAAEGEEGEGEEAEKAAPYNIEGLNRDPVNAPMPQYTAQANATIKVRITVDPQGRIIRRVPLLKGNPALERSVLDALGRWRFNALPSAAPQESQTGTITFSFRLE